MGVADNGYPAKLKAGYRISVYKNGRTILSIPTNIACLPQQWLHCANHLAAVEADAKCE